MIKHIVEREEAPHEHFRRGDPAAADVFGAESPVDVAPVDPTHAADAADAAHVLFDSHALLVRGDRIRRIGLELIRAAEQVPGQQRPR